LRLRGRRLAGFRFGQKLGRPGGQSLVLKTGPRKAILKVFDGSTEDILSLLPDGGPSIVVDDGI